MVTPDCFDCKYELFLVGKETEKYTWGKPTVIPRLENKKKKRKLREIEGKFWKHALSQIILKETKRVEFDDY